MASMRGGMEFAEGEPVKLPPPPGSMASRTLQLTCASRPEVVAGQRVRAGQMLAEPRDDRSGARLCPVDGTVRRIIPFDPQAHADDPVQGEEQVASAGGDGAAGDGPARARPGRWRYVVVVEPEDSRVPGTVATPPPQRHEGDAWLTTFRHTGPWLEYGLAFSLVEQLHAVRQRPSADATVICVGLDQFPPYPVRSSLLASFPDEAVLGTQILADLLGTTDRLMLATRHPRVLARLRHACRSYRLPLVAAHNTYPAADPTLVAWHHGPPRARRLPHGTNPGTLGLVLITPWTAIRLARWSASGRLDVVRPVLIAWPRARTPMTITWAMPGQTLGSLDPALAGDAGQLHGRVVLGNPMTGRAPHAPHDGHDEQHYPPIVPDEELLLSVLAPAPHQPAQPCISCGWCVDVCPTRLVPYRLATDRLSHPDRIDVAHQLPWCIHCGLCSHVCPSHLPLAQALAT